jgi:hypothetical protein
VTTELSDKWPSRQQSIPGVARQRVWSNFRDSDFLGVTAIIRPFKQRIWVIIGKMDYTIQASSSLFDQKTIPKASK